MCSIAVRSTPRRYCPLPKRTILKRIIQHFFCCLEYTYQPKKHILEKCSLFYTLYRRMKIQTFDLLRICSLFYLLFDIDWLGCLGPLSVVFLRGYVCMRQTKTRPEKIWFSKFLCQMKNHQKKFQPISGKNDQATAILIFDPHSRPSWKKIEFSA